MAGPLTHRGRCRLPTVLSGNLTGKLVCALAGSIMRHVLRQRRHDVIALAASDLRPWFEADVSQMNGSIPASRSSGKREFAELTIGRIQV
jgi:hypothetical protein